MRGSGAIGGGALALGLGLAFAGVAVAVRLWNGLAGPRMWGYDAWGHASYALFVETYRGVPWADQGWSYFHPPLHYALGALLARAGDAETLMRGLPLLAALASLVTAACAAWVVRSTRAALPGLGWLAFAAVALLPVHLIASAMPGNEATAAALASACLAVFVHNECREAPRLPADALAGALGGLAMLAKFSGLLAPLAALLVLAGRAVRGSGRRAGARGAWLAGLVLLVSAPYYLRNLEAFGTPFAFSREHPWVARVEAAQAPGARAIADYLRFPAAVFRDPSPHAPALLGSVWGTAYAGVWADVFREPALERLPPAAGAMALAGLVPTALAGLGALLAARDLRRGRRRGVYAVLGLHAALTLGAFALFTWRVPTWSAVKASYLLGLSLPYAAALARGVEGLAARGGARAAGAATGAVAAVCAAAAWVGLEGAVWPPRPDAPAAAAVHAAFGETDAARRRFASLAGGTRRPGPWLHHWAAAELAGGRSGRARALYARAIALEERFDGAAATSPAAGLAAALASDGALALAEAQLDVLLAAEDAPALRANRGAVRAARGAADAARDDLRAALRVDPELVPAWLHLAALRAERGDRAGASRAHTHARRAACAVPRGHPHGVGEGVPVEYGIGPRWLLLREGDALRPAPRDLHRRVCRAPGTAPP